ncbi:hypothetical protein BVX95_00695 [archaeon D22]|nr:hypothetical protein BVX95_00695 [archaeon D22]
MNKPKSILAIIPVRGGSKRIPKKNIKPLNGKPLIYYTIEQAKQSVFVNRIIVSSDDDEILKISSQYEVEVDKRPSILATDTANTVDVLIELVKRLEKQEKYKPDVIVLLQATTPLRVSEDIDACIKKLIDSGSDSIDTFTRIKDHPYYAFTIDKDHNAIPLDPKNFTKRSQDLPDLYVENGAVYVVTRDTLINEHSLYGKKHQGHVMPQKRSIDIDEEIDFELAEFFITREQNGNKN